MIRTWNCTLYCFSVSLFLCMYSSPSIFLLPSLLLSFFLLLFFSLPTSFSILFYQESSLSSLFPKNHFIIISYFCCFPQLFISLDLVSFLSDLFSRSLASIPTTTLVQCLQFLTFIICCLPLNSFASIHTKVLVFWLLPLEYNFEVWKECMKYYLSRLQSFEENDRLSYDRILTTSWSTQVHAKQVFTFLFTSFFQNILI